MLSGASMARTGARSDPFEPRRFRANSAAVCGYFVGRWVKSFALEQRISSICRASTSALVFSASIFEASGCCFSSSSIRSLNEASSRRRCSISASLLTGPTVFQTLCAGMMRPLLRHAFVNPNRGQKWKLSWRGYDRPGGRDNFGKSELRLDSQPKSVLEIAAKHYAQATRGRYVRSGCDTFGFGRDRQAERRFQEELRLGYRSHSLPAFDKCCSASVVFLANFDSQ